MFLKTVARRPDSGLVLTSNNWKGKFKGGMLSKEHTPTHAGACLHFIPNVGTMSW
jgi:hypothetical protein